MDGTLESGVDSTEFAKGRQPPGSHPILRAILLVIGFLTLVVGAALAWLTLTPGAAGLRERAGRLATATVVDSADLAGARLEDLRLVSTSGLVARCMLRSPSATADLRPAFLIAAGYESGRRAVTFPDERAVVLLACDYPLQLPTDLRGATFWRDLPALRRGILDTPATLLLALDYLAGRADVDSASIAVVGASVGVPPAVVAAALEPRAKGAAFLYGGGDLPLLFAHNVDLGAAWRNRLTRLAVAILTHPVEPARYAGAIAPRPVLVVNAPQDPFIPRASAEALHRALHDPKDVRWLPFDHFAAFHERDLLAELTEVTRAWFIDQGIGGGQRPSGRGLTPAGDRAPRN